MNWVFADANGWIALNSKRDQLHGVAVDVNKSLLRGGRRYITTNFVLDETYTGLRMKVGHLAAVDFGERLRKSRTVHVVHITEGLQEEAWQFFKQYADKEFSFTDCTSFVVMQQMRIVDAFTNDHHFEQVGFTSLLKP